MKRRYILLAGIIAFAAAAWLFWRLSSKQLQTMRSVEGLSPAPASTAAAPTSAPPSPGPAGHATTTQEKAAILAAFERAEASQREYSESYRQSLNVYGVVLEEQTQRPIAGATVELSPLDQPGFDAKQSTPTTVQTDAQGRFSFTGHRGESLSFDVHKKGYYELPGQSNGRFVHTLPDPQVHNQSFAPDPAQPARSEHGLVPGADRGREVLHGRL